MKISPWSSVLMAVETIKKLEERRVFNRPFVLFYFFLITWSDLGVLKSKFVAHWVQRNTLFTSTVFINQSHINATTSNDDDKETSWYNTWCELFLECSICQHKMNNNWTSWVFWILKHVEFFHTVCFVLQFCFNRRKFQFVLSRPLFC